MNRVAATTAPFYSWLMFLPTEMLEQAIAILGPFATTPHTRRTGKISRWYGSWAAVGVFCATLQSIVARRAGAQLPENWVVGFLSGISKDHLRIVGELLVAFADGDVAFQRWRRKYQRLAPEWCNGAAQPML